eukprot:CAMPEP_0179281204 /NCGR_PEP_ID=MMETSP0797-20121207/37031_1 /TAXON_ID=47934 /ORGANISM="Dinophysis acuminata, Strain DAEP01" /LENGTH=373 /DNA_ID=CAMNT_0020989901 /DNA_START=65 /DNA_END=1186 /DNA_ORIENTATION=-
MAAGDTSGAEAALDPKGGAAEKTTAPVVAGPPSRGMPGRPPEDGVAVRPAGGAAGRCELVATRSFFYGDAILQERPLLCIPPKAGPYLKEIASDELVAVARHLGDAQRLAVFAAFCRLPEEQREAVLSMGVSAGCTVVGDTKKIVGMFLKDCPQFAGALDWDLFARVVGVMSDRGAVLPSGERALYRLVDQAAHSCTPNAVVETLGGDGGVKEIRAIAHAGICEGEAVTVSCVPEEVLVLPLEKRRAALRETRGGLACPCRRCADGQDPEDALQLLQRASNVDKDTDEPTLRERLEQLRLLDSLLPFALVGKARARAKLAGVCEKCKDGVLWEEAAKLYEAAADETSIVLGQKSLNAVSNLKRRLKVLSENLD